MLNRQAIAFVLLCATLSRAQAQFQSGEFISFSADAWGVEPSAGNAAALLVNSFDFV